MAATPNLVVVIAIYIVIQLAYCFGLKHQASSTSASSPSAS